MSGFENIYMIYLLIPIGRLIMGKIGKLDIQLNPLSDTIPSFWHSYKQTEIINITYNGKEVTQIFIINALLLLEMPGKV